MADTGTETRLSISIGPRLRRKPALVTKLRRLDELLMAVLGEVTPIEWDLSAEEADNGLSLHVGTPGQGECTRQVSLTTLDDSVKLQTLFQDVKHCQIAVQQYLAEVAKLFQHLRDWLSRAAVSYRVEELPTTVEEELTGPYAATKLVIRRRKKVAEVVPRGVFWVTTDGCVEITNEEDEDQLYLSREEGGWYWLETTVGVGKTGVTTHVVTEEVFLRLVGVYLT